MDNLRLAELFFEALDRKAEEKLAWAPALAGGLLLGGSQAISGVHQAREQGASWGDALQQGAKSGLTGAAIGAAGGAALQLGGKRFASMQNAAQGVTDYGKKTLHALTGYGGVEGLRAAGGGSAATARALDQAQKHMGSIAPANTKDLASAAKSVQLAQKGHEAVQAAEEAGLTHLPGMVKGLATKPVDTAKKLWGATVHGLSPLEKGLFGVGTAMGVHGALQDRDPDNPRSTLSKAVSAGTNLGLNVATAPLQLAMTTKGIGGALLGQMTVGSAINQGLELPSREIQRKLDVPPSQMPPPRRTPVLLPTEMPRNE